MKMRAVSDRLRGPLLLPLSIGVFSLFRATSDGETDAFWTAREGMALLAGSPLVHADSWSWAPVDGPFVPNSPGWQLLLGWAWTTAGSTGLLVCSWAAIAGSMAGISWMARRLGADDLASVFVLLLLTLFAGPAFVNRAATPALVLFLCSIFIGHGIARSAAGRRGAILLLAFSALVGYIGMWLHTSWAVWAPALTMSMALLAWGARDSARHRLSVAAAGSGAVLGALAGPLGLEAWRRAPAVAEACRGLIREWMSPASAGLAWVLVWLALATLLTALSIPVARRWRRDLDPLSVLLLAGAAVTLVAAAMALRFLLLAALMAAPVMAAELTRAAGLAPSLRTRARAAERGTAMYWRTITVMVVLALMPVVVAMVPKAYPLLRDPAVRALPVGCRLFAPDRIGGAVVLVRSDVPIWIDGRQDYWGRARISTGLQYLQVQNPEGLVPSGTTCVLLPSPDHELARQLLGTGEWRRVVAGELQLLVPVGLGDGA